MQEIYVVSHHGMSKYYVEDYSQVDSQSAVEMLLLLWKIEKEQSQCK